MKRTNPFASTIVAGRVPQYIIDEHTQAIINTIKEGGDVDFLLSCLNAIKDKPGYEYLRFAGQNAVMSGWLTVDDDNRFAVKAGVSCNS